MCRGARNLRLWNCSGKKLSLAIVLRIEKRKVVKGGKRWRSGERQSKPMLNRERRLKASRNVNWSTLEELLQYLICAKS